jgi:hypothetical protein
MENKLTRDVLAASLILCLLFPGLGGLAQASGKPSGAGFRPGGERSHPLRFDLDLIEHWGRTEGSSTYAGTYYSPRGGGILVIGFTSNGSRGLAEVRRIPGILEPQRLVLRRSVARNSLRDLRQIEERLIHRVVQGTRSGHLVVSWYIDVARNVLVVTSEHVRRAKKLIDHVFGRRAPIVIRSGERKVLS